MPEISGARKKELTPGNVLSVRVEVNVESNALASSERVDLALDSLELRTVTSGLSLVGLVTRVSGGTTSELPLVRPVTVDVTANTGVSRDSLSVLAPETVGSLGVDETCDSGLDDLEECQMNEAYHQG